MWTASLGALSHFASSMLSEPPSALPVGLSPGPTRTTSQTSFVIDGGWQGDAYCLLEPPHSSVVTDQEKRTKHSDVQHTELAISHPDGCCLTSLFPCTLKLKFHHTPLNLYFKTKCTPQHWYSRDTRVSPTRQDETFLSKPLWKKTRGFAFKP